MRWRPWPGWRPTCASSTWKPPSRRPGRPGWGENWVGELPHAQRRFAHRLIDLGAADVVHGHSSHHALPIEVHAGRLILYGCGDLVNDYEGIPATRPQRSDIGCLYAVRLSRADGGLRSLAIVPFQLSRFSLGPPDAAALQGPERSLAAGCRALGTRLQARAGGGWDVGGLTARGRWQEPRGRPRAAGRYGTGG